MMNDDFKNSIAPSGSGDPIPPKFGCDDRSSCCCTNLRLSLICFAFWQFSVASFAFVEAFKVAFFLNEYFYSALCVVVGISNSISSLCAFSNAASPRSGITLIIFTLLVNTVLHVVVVIYSFAFGPETPPIVRFSAAIWVPLCCVAFYLLGVAICFRKKEEELSPLMEESTIIYYSKDAEDSMEKFNAPIV
eukprot:Filipodium_phascolosomae@DN4886_c0_g1_i1.p1